MGGNEFLQFFYEKLLVVGKYVKNGKSYVKIIQKKFFDVFVNKVEVSVTTLRIFFTTDCRLKVNTSKTERAT